jgi:NAD(P)-dependent dehydrogenase (short-subunit alcohol dehydrogenase family)
MDLGSKTVRFSHEDLALFSQASGDHNPLHLSADYARKTPFGQQVVYGALSAIACLGQLELGEDARITSVSADFLRPMFLDTNYSVEAAEREGAFVVRVLDGSVPLMVLTVKVQNTSEAAHGVAGEVPLPHFERWEARVLAASEIRVGMEITGQYACEIGALETLRQRWGVRADSFLLEVLLWSSYLVGMELPGQSALFARLQLTLESSPRCPVAFEYTAAVRSFDTVFGQLRTTFTLRTPDGTLAIGETRAFVRPVLEISNEPLVESDALAGRVAVLIGATRGLGAALYRVLKSQGATVVAVSRSADTASSSDLVTGDAADPELLAEVREQILRIYGRVDFLICNACPPVLPLRVEPATLGRMDAFMSTAVALVAHPMAAFLNLIEKTKGCCVVISSTAVDSPVRDWPHYVAAKQAIEGIAQVAVLQYPQLSALIVRPEKLLTDMTNTPMGRRGAADPTEFAQRVVERLGQPFQAGTAEIFR